MNRYCLLLMCSLFIAVGTHATLFKGQVLEYETGDPVVGALVQIMENTDINEVTGLDGTFLFKDLPPGSYTLIISYLSFHTDTEKITVTDALLPIPRFRLRQDQNRLKEVAVTATKDGAGEHTARNIERNADQVMNIISGNAIRISPDLTVANVAQRISGVSIERNSNGDGQYAILRGMDKRYNYTLVNGVKIPSPDNKYRYVPLDIFPSELLDRLEVYKALTPDMEGDAIGGAVNMVMKDAPDQLAITANIATGYSELFMNRDFMSYRHQDVSRKSPYEINGSQYAAQPDDFNKASTEYSNKRPLPNILAGLSIGDRFFNRKFGVILAGSFQNTYRGSNSLFFGQQKLDTFRGVTLTKRDTRQYSEQQQRTGLHAKMDYRFNDRSKLQWYNAFMNLTNIQVRDTRGTELTMGGYDPEQGNATLEYATRSRITIQNIYNSTLQGTHQLTKRLRLDWSAVYSVATSSQPDNTTIPLHGQEVHFTDTRTTVDDATRRWEHNTDQDFSGYTHLTYNQPIAHVPVEWMIGGMYRDKQRSNFYNQYQLRPENLLAAYGVDFRNYSDIEWSVENPRGSVASALNYDATEKVAAGFFRFKIQAKKLEVTGGLRAEHTDQGYTMKFQIGEDRPAGAQQYLDLLPSLHFKLMPWKNTNIRASYFRSINRPGFFEIVPYRIVNEDYQERGNPDLKHAIADNIDLRYEWFSRPGEQLMAGLFYKHIQNPIEYTLQPDAVRGQDIFYAPGNFGNADNYGAEIDFIRYFNKFGIKANYTYTRSAITTPKSKRIRNEDGDLNTVSVNQTRPLSGQAAHIANLSLLFKDTKNGWDAQLAGNYTGNRINTVSQFLDDDLWQKGFVQLDFSLEKTFRNGWGIFVKAGNLLNTPMELYIKNTNPANAKVPGQDLNDRTLIQKDFYQRTYLIGLRYKF